jgi:alkylhydroperoxidase/carboxymuconolactone decarboxylase family protein YurZ
MSATKALTCHTDLTTAITTAALGALKAGMTKDEIAAILAAVASMLENSDG